MQRDDPVGMLMNGQVEEGQRIDFRLQKQSLRTDA